MAKTTKSDANQAPTPEAVCRTRRTDIRQLINGIEIEMTDGGALTENGWADAAVIAEVRRHLVAAYATATGQDVEDVEKIFAKV